MVQEKYEQLKVGTDVQVGSAADDHLFFKASGGWTDKGTIYGLGREGPAMFEKPTTSRRSGSSAYSSPVVTQLQDQLQATQNELQTTQSRLHSTEDELRTTREELSTTRHELEATRKQLDEQRIGLLELNARFDSFSALLGHPTRADNSQASSQM